MMKERLFSLPTFFFNNSDRNLCPHTEKAPRVLHECRSLPTAPKSPGYIALQVICISGNYQVRKCRELNFKLS